MNTFADSIEALNPEDDKEFFASLPDELKKDVSVALIDDGVQFGHEPPQGKIKDSWSFDDGYDGADLPGARKPFHESQTGHGTLMASMICRVCPGAKIFSCRLKVIPGDGLKFYFTPESAAELAHEKGALIFCAVPDEGSMTDKEFSKYYPVGCAGLAARIFKIGAATANNERHEWVGKESQLDFLLPGHEVTERGEDTVDPDGDIPKTGSSIATALAAGLAALVIYCVRLAAIETYRKETGFSDENKKTLDSTDAVTEDSLGIVKTFNGMKQIL
ncbi:peptidase S8/S53 domain-containing protein [Durotheca rogersii]|uniref:peptidase S8/S53 domain-containing protein n=1 Tax=Durotheca rogersii TaxID=419775 RepID=UPI00221FF1C3|nr:peptidase S8/S53 domain-containing protein [Durotheca rogersii]KAI5864682.1 peptidase S8/S53 domain-containing protein [Durotheca rogersii]